MIIKIKYSRGPGEGRSPLLSPLVCNAFYYLNFMQYHKNEKVVSHSYDFLFSSILNQNLN